MTQIIGYSVPFTYGIFICLGSALCLAVEVICIPLSDFEQKSIVKKGLFGAAGSAAFVIDIGLLLAYINMYGSLQI